VSAFKFTNANNISRYGRYRVLPAAGNEYLDEPEAAARSPDFLFDEIKERAVKEPVRFRIAVQLAEDGDTIDDATVRWPEERPQLTFGEISLQEIAPNNGGEQQHIIFDPIPRVDGIEASADPLFEPRANVYLMSGGGAERPESTKRQRKTPFHAKRISADRSLSSRSKIRTEALPFPLRGAVPRLALLNQDREPSHEMRCGHANCLQNCGERIQGPGQPLSASFASEPRPCWK
jgi:Catalase